MSTIPTIAHWLRFVVAWVLAVFGDGTAFAQSGTPEVDRGVQLRNGQAVRVGLALIDTSEPNCGAGDYGAKRFYFDIKRLSRVRVTATATASEFLIPYLEVQGDGVEPGTGCKGANANTDVEWTALLPAGHYDVLLFARSVESLSESRQRQPSSSNPVTVKLDIAAPARVRYDEPFKSHEIRRGTHEGDTFFADARVKLSCAETGVPTQAFEVVVREHSTFTFWIPPEDDSTNNVYALLRTQGTDLQELDCGDHLRADVQAGRYLLVAAGASKHKMGKVSIPYKLHSLAQEERSAKNAEELPLGKLKRGSTRNSLNVFNRCDVRRVGHSAPDKIYRAHVPRRGTLSVRVEPKADYDGWVAIVDQKLQAIDPEQSWDSCAHFPGDALKATVEPGQYYVIVDGIGLNAQEAGSSFTGDFEVRVDLE